jgi:hypothetical protein
MINSNTPATLPRMRDLRAGRAIVTVENGKGDHVTFRVTAPGRGTHIDREAPVRFVGVMVGTDNEAHYAYVGLLGDDGSIRPTKGSKLPMDDQRVRVVAWAIRKCVEGELPAGYRIRHAGCCLRCGRTLTNPDSLDIMYGPECAGKMEG